MTNLLNNHLLYYNILQPKNPISSTSIVLLHGLFGDHQNLGLLGRYLQNYFKVIAVDIRNHGQSPQTETMCYSEIAIDVIELLSYLNQKNVILIGHSMGGKVAMTMASLMPNFIEKIIIIDIAPVSYHIYVHKHIFFALEQVVQSGVTSRKEAAIIMRNLIIKENKIQFLLKSFNKGKWKFNLPVLKKNYHQLMNWKVISPCRLPALFISGSFSNYIAESYYENIINQFPEATIHIVLGCGHWVHIENSEAVIRAIYKFLNIHI
ncbi:alpha/beta fold hydrolase [Arsenophonus endosymbiont of Lipoptena cervi]|uniref:alpha/beta fold hydrolase n=1 Tax=Arsenophonus endosymbiont of Lipoptena cervi TaxID=363258 RepID=UPI00376EB0B9